MSVLAVAHRAGNDLDTVRAAVAAGADVIEADVHRYRGRLEVRHSKSLGPFPYLWDSGEPLTSTRVPQLQLASLLAALPPGARLMLDLKGPGAVGRHAARTVLEQLPDRPVLVCSRWWPGVEAFTGLPGAQPVLTARNRVELQRLRRRVRGTRAPYGVSLHRSLLEPTVVAELRDRVALVLTWGVEDEVSLEQVLARGVTGVISSSPAVLAQVRALRVR